MVLQPRQLIKSLGTTCLIATLYACGASAPVQQTSTTEEVIPNSGDAQVVEQSNKSQLGPEIEQEFKHGIKAMVERDYDKAEEIFYNMTRANPNLSGPYANLGVILKTKKDYQNAEIALKRALELNPENPEIYNHLGLVYRESGRFNNAFEIYKQGLEFAPENINLLRNTGILLELYLNTPEAALPYYQRYLEKKPDDKQVQIWIADLNLRLGL